MITGLITALLFLALWGIGLLMGVRLSHAAIAKAAEQTLADIHATDGDGKLELSDFYGWLRTLKFMKLISVFRGADK